MNRRGITEHPQPAGTLIRRSLTALPLAMVSLAAAGCGAKEGTVFMPEQASTYAADVDWLFYYIFWVCVFFTTLIVVLMIYFAFKFRQRERGEWAQGSTHSTSLEIGWTIVPTVLVLSFFVFGFRGMLDMYTPPETEADRVYVNAKQWNWSFRYKNGATGKNLYLKCNRPVELVMTSDDVIHSLWVPAFRGKKDVVPGRYTKIWFEPEWDQERAGRVELDNDGDGTIDETYEKGLVYDLKCTEYCGQDHSRMLTKVIVLPPSEYDKAMARIANPTDTYESPAKYGEALWSQYCSSCHSVDGSAATGPTWLNLWGKRQVMSSGESIVVDEDYVKESIAYPQAKIVRTYENQRMSSFKTQFGEAEYIGVIDYMRQLSGEEVQKSWPGGTKKQEEREEDARPPADADAEAMHGEVGACCVKAEQEREAG